MPKVSKNHNYREVLNDTNKDLINLYKVAQSQPQEFINKLNQIPYSEYWYNYYRKKTDIQDPIEKAVGFYIRIQMSFANKLDNGFGFSKYSRNNSATYSNRIKNILTTIERLKGTYIFDRDALDLIEKFDCPEAFFYCDPPYPGTDQGHYSGYTQQDFENLIETLKNIQGQFLLSCYDNPAVPSDWERFEFDARCTASNTAKGGHREKRKEIVWRKLNGYGKINSAQMEMF